MKFNNIINQDTLVNLSSDELVNFLIYNKVFVKHEGTHCLSNESNIMLLKIGKEIDIGFFETLFKEDYLVSNELLKEIIIKFNESVDFWSQKEYDYYKAKIDYHLKYALNSKLKIKRLEKEYKKKLKLIEKSFELETLSFFRLELIEYENIDRLLPSFLGSSLEIIINYISIKYADNFFPQSTVFYDWLELKINVNEFFYTKEKITILNKENNISNFKTKTEDLNKKDFDKSIFLSLDAELWFKNTLKNARVLNNDGYSKGKYSPFRSVANAIFSNEECNVAIFSGLLNKKKYRKYLEEEYHDGASEKLSKFSTGQNDFVIREFKPFIKKLSERGYKVISEKGITKLVKKP